MRTVDGSRRIMSRFFITRRGLFSLQCRTSVFLMIVRERTQGASRVYMTITKVDKPPSCSTDLTSDVLHIKSNCSANTQLFSFSSSLFFSVIQSNSYSGVHSSLFLVYPILCTSIFYETVCLSGSFSLSLSPLSISPVPLYASCIFYVAISLSGGFIRPCRSDACFFLQSYKDIFARPK